MEMPKSFYFIWTAVIQGGTRITHNILNYGIVGILRKVIAIVINVSNWSHDTHTARL